VLVGIGLPVAALAVYLAVGSPGALSPQADPGAVTAEQVDDMVGRLAARLRESPDDVDGWKMLGRSYAVLGRFGEAVDAYAKAAAREPRDAALLADFADALAMTRGQSLQGEPEQLVLRALEIDPQNLKALALAGTAAFERKAFAAAADFWQRMLPLVPPGSEDAQAIRDNVAQATQLAGGQPPAPRAAAPQAAALRGTVRIAPTLKGKFGPEDTVFIYARAAEGPPMPLAVQRVKARELPVSFALDDAMAMAPGMELSAHPRVVVTARVSKSGGATPQPGDLQGASAPVANDASGVTVLIDTEVR
jgi:cytochrome c-type biogenesis protein CcmH